MNDLYKITTDMSFEDLHAHLQFTETRWRIRLWDKNLPNVFLVDCENILDIIQRLRDMFVYTRVHLLEDVSPFADMAASHALAYHLLMHTEGKTLTEYELKVQAQATLDLLFERPGINLRTQEFPGFSRLYTETFVEAYFTTQKQVQQASRTKEEGDSDAQCS